MFSGSDDDDQVESTGYESYGELGYGIPFAIVSHIMERKYGFNSEIGAFYRGVIVGSMLPCLILIFTGLFKIS